MANDYYSALDLPQQFGPATAEQMGRRFRQVEAGFDRLPTEDRLKRGLVGTGEDQATDPDTVQIVTGDVAFGSYAAYQRGQSVGWIATAENTGAVVVSVDGGPVVPLLDSALGALAAGHLQAGAFVRAVFTGTAFSVVEATATIRPGGEGAAFTREQIVEIVRSVVEGGSGAGAVVVSDVHDVGDAASLAAVDVVRRWVCVRVTAAFSAGGESFQANDVWVWDNAQTPPGWRLVYREPPTTVLPRDFEALGALVSPEAVARMGVVVHETASGTLYMGRWAPAVAGRMAFAGMVAQPRGLALATWAPAVAAGLAFTNE